MKASSRHLRPGAGVILSDNWGSQTRPPAERWARRSCFLFATTERPSQTTGGGLLSPLRSFGTNGPVRTTSSAVLHHWKVNAQFSSRAKQRPAVEDEEAKGRWLAAKKGSDTQSLINRFLTAALKLWVYQYLSASAAVLGGESWCSVEEAGTS